MSGERTFHPSTDVRGRTGVTSSFSSHPLFTGKDPLRREVVTVYPRPHIYGTKGTRNPPTETPLTRTFSRSRVDSGSVGVVFDRRITVGLNWWRGETEFRGRGQLCRTLGGGSI